MTWYAFIFVLYTVICGGAPRDDQTINERANLLSLQVTTKESRRA